jgi:hypothetical protein
MLSHTLAHILFDLNQQYGQYQYQGQAYSQRQAGQNNNGRHKSGAHGQDSAVSGKISAEEGSLCAGRRRGHHILGVVCEEHEPDSFRRFTVSPSESCVVIIVKILFPNVNRGGGCFFHKKCE